MGLQIRGDFGLISLLFLYRKLDFVHIFDSIELNKKSKLLSLLKNLHNFFEKNGGLMLYNISDLPEYIIYDLTKPFYELITINDIIASFFIQSCQLQHMDCKKNLIVVDAI